MKEPPERRLQAGLPDATRDGSLGRSYLNIFRECVMSISHCIDNYIPGILNWAEMYEVFGVPRQYGAGSLRRG